MAVDQQPVIPSVTGSPGLDSLIRSGLIAAAAALTGIIVGWLNAHGFTDPNLSALIGTVILSVLGMGAVAAWGYIQKKTANNAVVQHVVDAITTGTVAPAVINAATPAQTIQLTNALGSTPISGAKP